MNLIFDLDGTLIDSRMRLYRLFQQLVPASEFTFDEYWQLKKSRQSHYHILLNHFGLDSEAIDNFLGHWMKLIEAEEFLALDEPFPDLDATLTRLGERAILHLCTARQCRGSALVQLERLKLLPHFDQVLVTSQKFTKEHLISQHVQDLSSHDWIIGDTGKDIQTGKALGIKTCAVLSGFMSETALREYQPDVVLCSAADFTVGHFSQSRFAMTQ
jgi:phosphoglycolate phosphatase